MIHCFSAGKEAIAVNEKLLIVDDEKPLLETHARFRLGE